MKQLEGRAAAYIPGEGLPRKQGGGRRANTVLCAQGPRIS